MSRAVTLHQAGGFERHTDLVASALADAGHAVVLVTSRLPRGAAPDVSRLASTGRARDWNRAPGSLRLVPCSRGLPGRYELGYWNESRALLFRLHAAEAFDLLISAGWGAAAAVASEDWPGLDCPAAMLAHGSPRSELAAKRRRLGRSPLYALHWMRARAARARYALAASRFDRILAVSPSVALRLSAEFLIAPERLRVVMNGVALDTPMRDPLRPLPAGDTPAHALRIVTVGRLHPEKGVALLLRAAGMLLARGLHVSVEIAGDGPQRASLERLCRQTLAPETVRFHGALPPSAVARLLAAADVCAFPSTCDEGLPLALLEAMAARVAIVASRVAGVTDAVRDRIEADLVAPGDPAAIADAIASLAHDSPRALALARAARQRCEQDFSRERMLSHLERELVALARPARRTPAEAPPQDKPEG
jgi:glycosyltransferase involved in cell wall biosynthesis